MFSLTSLKQGKHKQIMIIVICFALVLTMVINNTIESYAFVPAIPIIIAGVAVVGALLIAMGANSDTIEESASYVYNTMESSLKDAIDNASQMAEFYDSMYGLGRIVIGSALADLFQDHVDSVYPDNELTYTFNGFVNTYPALGILFRGSEYPLVPASVITTLSGYTNGYIGKYESTTSAGVYYYQANSATSVNLYIDEYGGACDLDWSNSSGSHILSFTNTDTTGARQVWDNPRFHTYIGSTTSNFRGFVCGKGSFQITFGQYSTSTWGELVPAVPMINISGVDRPAPIVLATNQVISRVNPDYSFDAMPLEPINEDGEVAVSVPVSSNVGGTVSAPTSTVTIEQVAQAYGSLDIFFENGGTITLEDGSVISKQSTYIPTAETVRDTTTSLPTEVVKGATSTGEWETEIPVISSLVGAISTGVATISQYLATTFADFANPFNWSNKTPSGPGFISGLWAFFAALLALLIAIMGLIGKVIIFIGQLYTIPPSSAMLHPTFVQGIEWARGFNSQTGVNLYGLITGVISIVLGIVVFKLIRKIITGIGTVD